MFVIVFATLIIMLIGHTHTFNVEVLNIKILILRRFVFLVIPYIALKF